MRLLMTMLKHGAPPPFKSYSRILVENNATFLFFLFLFIPFKKGYLHYYLLNLPTLSISISISLTYREPSKVNKTPYF